VNPLVQVVGVLLFLTGIGCAVGVIRVVLPGLARATDRSLAAAGTGRLVLAGVLPLVGAVLLLWAIHAAGLPGAVALVLALPLLLLAVLGATAAVPHLGARLLRGGESTSLLARCVVGALVAGLSLATWALQPLGILVSLLLFGWMVGIGMGLFLRARDEVPTT
jgi:hypothetical protein